LLNGWAHRNNEATVYVESDGVGHAYIEIDGTVYSYGRYDGSDSPSSGALGPVGNGVLLKTNHKYAADRMEKYPTTSFKTQIQLINATAYSCKKER
jgi:hypothetical protein